jgi:hypothetical protein
MKSGRRMTIATVLTRQPTRVNVYDQCTIDWQAEIAADFGKWERMIKGRRF